LEEIPHLQQLYDKYKNQGLDIISISVDTDKDAWYKKCKTLALPWQQLIDNNIKTEAEKSIIKYYNANTIPFNILIDQEMKIIMMNVHGEELEKFLSDTFSR
jgi:alkyl hydroperoxide reductase subunit AhpC